MSRKEIDTMSDLTIKNFKQLAPWSYNLYKARSCKAMPIGALKALNDECEKTLGLTINARINNGEFEMFVMDELGKYAVLRTGDALVDGVLSLTCEPLKLMDAFFALRSVFLGQG